MKLKRGAVDIQFNWILVLIAGTAILILFTGFVIKEKNISEESKSASTLKYLDTILASSEISMGTVNAVKIPKTKIEFECGRYSISGFSKQLNTMPFAPLVLESDKVISMALGWSIPYRITNLLYLTNLRIRYIFVGDSLFARKIFEMMPDETRNDGYTQVQAIQDENDDNVRIIFFDQYPQVPESLKGMKKGSVTALKVDGDENTGTLEFFDLIDDKFEFKGRSYYLKESTLMGAIFTDSLEVYDCVMEDAFKKLNIVSQVYERKIANLKSYYKNQECEQYYDNSLITTIKEASDVFSQSSINDIDIAAKDLEEQNKKAQLSSCTLIY